MEKRTGSKLGKEYVKAVYCHPDYLTYMQSTSWETLGWMKHKLESRLPGEVSITSDMQKYHSSGRKWRGTKESLDEGERGEWKSWLKIQYIKKTKIMQSGPITSWQIEGEKMETVTDFFLASRITADGDCSHKMKRSLLLGRKSVTNLKSMLRAETSFCQQRSI